MGEMFPRVSALSDLTLLPIGIPTHTVYEDYHYSYTGTQEVVVTYH